jgi:hypothetical protein
MGGDQSRFEEKMDAYSGLVGKPNDRYNSERM